MTIHLIAAIDKANGIGYRNELPWKNIPEDFKRFKALTTGHPIIMGRRTYRSLGKPLPNRLNIILSREVESGDHSETAWFSSLEKALSSLKSVDVFVIGGGEIYKQAFPYASSLYLTRVKGIHEADTHWDPGDLSKWTRENLGATFREHPDIKHLEGGGVRGPLGALEKNLVCEYFHYTRETPERTV